MEANEWHQVEALLNEAFRLTERERKVFLAQIADPKLRTEVETLLEADHSDAVTIEEVIAEAAQRFTPENPADMGSGESLEAEVTIDRYRLLQTIGEGGMGVVYLAEQYEPVRRLVAVKVIKPGMDTRQLIARFSAERQTVALMDHPNIAKVLDAGSTSSGRPYFVMELVEGMPITRYCNQQKLTIRERLELFIPVCQAVQHAHQKGIIHRDLKPSNILVTMYDGKPTPKVIDFGLAKPISPVDGAATAFTVLGAIVGTLQYMSPEQARAGADDLDTRTDVYSLGAILYELLTGTAPLSRGGVNVGGYVEMLSSLLEHEIPPPSERIRESSTHLPLLGEQRRTDSGKLRKAVRGDLDWIVMKALEKERDRRYASANGLGRDIERYLSGEPVEAGPPSAAYRFGKFARRNRALLGLATGFIALLITAAGVSISFAIRANEERDRAVTAGQEANARKLAAYASENLREDPELSIMLAMHAVNGLHQLGKPVSAAVEGMLHQAIAASRVPVTLSGHTDDVACVQFSPDGTRVLTGSHDRTAKVWDAQTGRELFSLRGHTDWVWDASFSPDGKLIATASPDRTARLWDAATGRQTAELRGHNHSVSGVAFSADNHLVATVGVDMMLRVWDARTSRMLATAATGGRPLSVTFGDSNGRVLVTTTVDEGKSPPRARLTQWDARTGRRLTTRPLGALFAAKFSEDGKFMLTMPARDSFRIAEAGTGREVRTHRFAHPVYYLGPLGRSGTFLGMDSESGRQVLDLSTDGAIVPSAIPAAAGLLAAFSPDAGKFATRKRKSVMLWTFRPDGALRTFKAHTDRTLVRFAPHGQLGSVTRDGATKIWNAESGLDIASFKAAGHAPFEIAFSPDGKLAVTGGSDKTARVWRVSTGDELLVFHGHNEPVHAVAFSPDGKRIVSGGQDKLLKLWDAGTGRELRIFQGHEQRILCVTFSPDGRRIGSAGVDNTARIWDAATGRELLTLRGHKDAIVGHGFAITSISFAPDGKTIATSSIDGTARLWDAASGEHQRTLAGHKHVVLDLNFSPDGKRIVTASLDKTVKVWDAVTGRELFAVGGHEYGVYSATFRQDGKRLATSDAKGTIRIFPIDVSDVFALARSRVTRALTPAECAKYLENDSCPALP